MKKMKTVFEMIYSGKHDVTMGDVRPESAWVFTEPGVLATIKFDGTATAIINGKFYARFDVKKGRKVPANAIACEPAPDPVTGHWPHWVPVTDDPTFKWYKATFANSKGETLPDATYEAVGPHFQGNPYNLEKDVLVKHGSKVVTDLPTPMTKESLRDYFESHMDMEGLVFYGKDNKRAKLRMKDFGLNWN